MLRVNVESQGEGQVTVVMEGEITAHASFDELLGRRERMVLDLSGVRRLNSQGVQTLLSFLEESAARGPVAAERCSCAVVMQLNLMPRMADLLEVRSVYVPLECPRCFHEDETLVELDAPGIPPLPALRCASCQKADYELAEIPARYFAFRARA